MITQSEECSDSSLQVGPNNFMKEKCAILEEENKTLRKENIRLRSLRSLSDDLPKMLQTSNRIKEHLEMMDLSVQVI